MAVLGDFVALITSRSLFANGMFKFGMARRMATSDWMVLLYTTGLYCLKSSDVNPLSWIILGRDERVAINCFA